ncbi:RICIN domain-containing protein [Saccharothrix sp. S26]|uniref:RICIN domain-containing protein n=1 Tax=Saccharothrix sp. S26 TaxID=2907215 RepID=UPI001F24AD24|nr:RICIN domain-containing protein [Saccharothrix sp. S26]MCE6995391.1 RICIN domain-containing protein [Saccharothrix sp. S26]
MPSDHRAGLTGLVLSVAAAILGTLFMVTPAQADDVQIVSVINDLCMGVEYASLADQAHVVQQYCSGALQQRFERQARAGSGGGVAARVMRRVMVLMAAQRIMPSGWRS